MKEKKLKLVCVFLLLGVLTLHSQAKQFSLKKSDSWLIIDGETCNINDSWLEEYDRLGYILNLHFDNNRDVFYHQSENGITTSFNSFLKQLLEKAKTNNKRFSILFNIDDKYIERFNELISSIDDEQLSEEDISKKRVLFDILNAHDPIIYFTLSESKKFVSSVHNFYDYFEIHNLDKDDIQSRILNTSKAQASMLCGIYKSLNKKEGELPYNTKIDERHNWQEKYLNDWQKTGLQPIFIVANCELKDSHAFIEIANTSKYTNSCNGVVTVNDVPLDYVYWLDEKPLLSYGYFNIPLSNSRLLRPHRAGYKFNPEYIEVNQGNQNSFLKFRATPVPLKEELQLHLKFNDSTITKSECPQLQEIFNCNIVKDKIRGNVLKVGVNGYIKLGTTNDYHIKGSSFSISFWFKTENKEFNRYPIFGSNTSVFREGLHVEMRQGAPYFGFFINDIWSKKKVDYMNWHHLVFSYDNESLEKRIYIDGKLSDVSLNSLSFVGDDTLYIGKCIGELSKFSFCIDNFNLWSRALNEIEVKRLQNEDVLFFEDIKEKKTFYLLLTISVIIIVFVIFSLHKKGVLDRIKPVRKCVNKENKNSIYLFGEFAVFDNDGNNIAPKMPRLIKELFIKLLVSKINGENGNTSEDLNETFWADMPQRKARNSRNVALARLRKYLGNVKGLGIEYVNEKHSILINDQFFVDYMAWKALSNSLSQNSLNNFIYLANSGEFLKDKNYSWLETYQDKVNREIMNVFLDLLQNSKFLIKDDLVEKMCKLILNLDDLNEEALKELLVLYKKQGKMTLMQQAYNDFITSYKKVYGADFELSIEGFV